MDVDVDVVVGAGAGIDVVVVVVVGAAAAFRIGADGFAVVCVVVEEEEDEVVAGTDTGTGMSGVEFVGGPEESPAMVPPETNLEDMMVCANPGRLAGLFVLVAWFNWLGYTRICEVVTCCDALIVTGN